MASFEQSAQRGGRRAAIPVPGLLRRWQRAGHFAFAATVQITLGENRVLNGSVLEHPGERFEFVLQHAVLLLQPLDLPDGVKDSGVVPPTEAAADFR